MSRSEASIDVFHAVSDATRRKILDLLADGERAVMDLVAHFNMSQPSISEHLRILREVGLVTVRKQGRRRLYSISPIHLREIASWLANYHRFWEKRLDKLGAYWDRVSTEPKPIPSINRQMTMEID